MHSYNICPNISIKDDPITPAGFPTSNNICHQSRRKSTPSLEYQSSTCLTQRHESCPLFSASPGFDMPEDIRYRSRRYSNPKFYLNVGLITLLVIIIILGVVFNRLWLPKVNAFIIPDWQKTQEAHSEYILPTSTSTERVIAPSTPTNTIQPTLTPSLMPTLTDTPEPTVEESNQVLELDTPIGHEKKFIIHRAVAGETLGLYATQYNTSVSAIRVINYQLPTVLYIDQILVIPVDMTDVSKLPAFETLQISSDGLTVPEIVEQLRVHVDAFRLYNNIPINHIFTSGEWVLVPRQIP